ncbi:MAG: hypothetical protein D6726_09370 [Nitrospirae bacterium]|nr:MAG: hypothetical protein D6726_09370 [Nitrospirota bacterium]
MPLKAVLHINEVDRLSVAINNARNLLRDTGGNDLDVLFLLNGAAVEALTSEDTLSALGELAEKGIEIHVCRNSLKNLCGSGLCLDEEALPSFIKVVPAGITALITLQNQGYAYIKP